MTTRYRSAAIIERRHHFAWCNREEHAYVCTHCLAIVPEPATGCRHCKRKLDIKTERFNAFLTTKQAAKEADCEDLI